MNEYDFTPNKEKYELLTEILDSVNSIIKRANGVTEPNLVALSMNIALIVEYLRDRVDIDWT